MPRLQHCVSINDTSYAPCMTGIGRFTACPTWLLVLLYKLQAIVDVLQCQVAALHGPQCCIFLQAVEVAMSH